MSLVGTFVLSTLTILGGRGLWYDICHADNIRRKYNFVMNVETTLIFTINVTQTDDDLFYRRSSRFLLSLFFVFVFVSVYLLFVTFLTF